MEPSLTIRRVPLDSLHLDPANAREHGPENLEAIVGSLRRCKQAEPLVVQKKTGRVIGGNGRLVAMKQLGWAECDILEVDLDDLNATALGIALNRTSELAAWNDSTLAKLLEELKVNDALDGVGYSSEDIGRLLDQLQLESGTGTGVDPDEIPEPPEEAVTRPGDLWSLGPHRLLCGDSARAEDGLTRFPRRGRGRFPSALSPARITPLPRGIAPLSKCTTRSLTSPGTP